MADGIGTPLVNFAEGKTQPELALLLGVSQSAISQMLNSNRDIRILIEQGLDYKAIELRPIGRRSKANKT